MVKITNYIMLFLLALLAFGTYQGVFNHSEALAGLAALAVGLFANATEN